MHIVLCLGIWVYAMYLWQNKSIFYKTSRFVLSVVLSVLYKYYQNHTTNTFNSI